MLKNELIDKSREAIAKAKHIVVLSGAGLDTNSGIPDFRSAKGIYSKAPEEMLSIDYFNKNPQEVMKFIKDNIYFPMAKPNEAHMLLAKLEHMGKSVTHITQNITDLLEQAGATNVFHVHGTIKTGTCVYCLKKYTDTEFFENTSCDCCEKSIIKPDIVFYGESILDSGDIYMKVRTCDLMIVIGTSLMVQPVAMYPQYTSAGVPIIVINKTPTYLDQDRMSIVFKEDITEVLKSII